jgi:hypothetical protein
MIFSTLYYKMIDVLSKRGTSMEINVEERGRIWKLASKTLKESVAMSGARGF